MVVRRHQLPYTIICSALGAPVHVSIRSTNMTVSKHKALCSFPYNKTIYLLVIRTIVSCLSPNSTNYFLPIRFGKLLVSGVR